MFGQDSGLSLRGASHLKKKKSFMRNILHYIIILYSINYAPIFTRWYTVLAVIVQEIINFLNFLIFFYNLFI